MIIIRAVFLLQNVWKMYNCLSLDIQKATNNLVYKILFEHGSQKKFFYFFFTRVFQTTPVFLIQNIV